MNGYQQSQVNRCVENQDHLSDWEKSFIQSMLDLPAGTELSEKQSNKLNEIDTRVAQAARGY